MPASLTTKSFKQCAQCAAGKSHWIDITASR